MNCRCCKCGRRRTLTRNQEASGTFKCYCGSKLWRVDKYRQNVEKKRPPCHCGMYPFPHRQGGGFCFHNKNLTEEDFHNMVASMRAKR